MRLKVNLIQALLALPLLFLATACRTTKPGTNMTAANSSSSPILQHRYFGARAVDCQLAWGVVGVKAPAPTTYTRPCSFVLGFAVSEVQTEVIAYISNGGLVTGTFQLTNAAPASAKGSGSSLVELVFGGAPKAVHTTGELGGNNTRLSFGSVVLSSIVDPSSIDTAADKAELRLVESSGTAAQGLMGTSFTTHSRQGGHDIERTCKFAQATANVVSCNEEGGLVFTGTYTFEPKSQALIIALPQHAPRRYSVHGTDWERRLVPERGPPPVQQFEQCGKIEYVGPGDVDNAHVGIWLLSPQGNFLVDRKTSDNVRTAMRKATPTDACLNVAGTALPPTGSKITVTSFRAK